MGADLRACPPNTPARIVIIIIIFVMRMGIRDVRLAPPRPPRGKSAAPPRPAEKVLPRPAPPRKKGSLAPPRKNWQILRGGAGQS